MSLCWEHPSDKVDRYFEPIAPTVVEFDYEPPEPVGELLDASGHTLRTVYPPTARRVAVGYRPPVSPPLENQ